MNAYRNKFAEEQRKQNWKYIRDFMIKKHFSITEKESTDIIHFRSGSARSLMIRLYEFFTQKKVEQARPTEAEGKNAKSHFMLPTFSKKASQEFIWAEKNHRTRKIFLLKSLEEHLITMGKIKKQSKIKEYMRTKKQIRKKIKNRKLDKTGENGAMVNTQTDLIVLKNHNNSKNNQSELSRVGLIAGQLHAALLQIPGQYCVEWSQELPEDVDGREQPDAAQKRATHRVDQALQAVEVD